MAISVRKKLATGTVIGVWNYGDDSTTLTGQAIGIKTKNDTFKALVNAESIRCAEGIKNRVVINKKLLDENDWVVIENQE